MNNYKSFLLPKLAQALPEDAPERALSLLALRNLWHILFDPIPKTLAIIPNDTNLMNDFLLFADSKQFSMNWALHVHLLNWLYCNSSLQDTLNDTHIQEIMVAAAARWAIDIISQPLAKGILLASPYLAKSAIGVWRGANLQESLRVFKFKIPAQCFPNKPSYAISFEYNVWNGIRWNELPQ